MAKINLKRLKAKTIKHHKKNLYHLETGVEYEYFLESINVKKRNNRWVEVNIDAGSCAFCQNLKCSGCPIATKEGGCSNTPWIDIDAAINTKNLDGVIKAEKDEIAFLESLEV